MTVQFIGWALVHSLWQGALITIVTTIALTLARRSPSRRRYGILLTALLLTAVAPPMTSAFLRGPGLRGSSGQITVLSGTNARSAVDTVALPADASSVAVQSDRPSAAPTATLSGSDASSASSAAVELAGAAREWLDRLMPWLVGLWLAGVALLSVRLVGGIRYTRRLLDDAVGSVDARLDAAVRRLAASVGVRRTVRVLQTARGHVPLVMGWLRPVLVVPASMLLGLSPTQLDLMLVHELAHIRRYEFLVNVVQAVIETLLFYHPAVWWLSSRIREKREHCCDDIALETLGADGMTYARALLTIEEGRGTAVGLAAAATAGSLLRRIRRLVAGEPARLELGSRWAAGIIGVAAVAIAANAMVAREVPAPARTSDGVVAAPDSRGAGPTPQRQLDSTRVAPASVTRIDGSQVLYLPIGGNEPVSARHNRAPVSSGWDTSLEGT